MEGNKGVHIANEIGTFFRGHNVIEYKSPKDPPDIDDFYKTAAYASLYKAYGKKLDERKADDITVSILHKSRPRELFRYLKEHGYTLFSPCRGIYYVEGKILFILVSVIICRFLHSICRTLTRYTQ